MRIMTYCCRHLWPVVDCGTYDGNVMDPNYVFNIEDEVDYVWDEFREFIAVGELDFDKYKDAMAKCIKDAFDTNKPLEKHGVKVVSVKIDSPREYNYRTDWADVEVDVPDDFVDKAIEYVESDDERMKTAKEWIKDYWLSYDGWISCMPDSWESMKRWHENGEARDIVVGGLLGILTKIDEPELLERNDGFPYPPITGDAYDKLSGYDASEFYPVYQPNELLRKYGLDAELKIDEYEDDISKVREKLGSTVEWRLDELAYADMFGGEFDKDSAVGRLIKALKEENIRKLQCSK